MYEESKTTQRGKWRSIDRNAVSRLQKLFIPCVDLAFEAKNYNRKLVVGWYSLINKHNIVSVHQNISLACSFPRRLTGGIINEISNSSTCLACMVILAQSTISYL